MKTSKKVRINPNPTFRYILHLIGITCTHVTFGLQRGMGFKNMKLHDFDFSRIATPVCVTLLGAVKSLYNFTLWIIVNVLSVPKKGQD